MFSVFMVVASCSSDQMEQQKKDGYIIKVTYDDNGGAFFDNKEDTLLVDMFNPANYQKGADGKVHIKLLDPTSPKRQTGGSSAIFVVKYNYSLAGWYKTRTLVTSDGKPVDAEGRKLDEENGKYYYNNEKGEKVFTLPEYTYADRWDFETDTLEYTEGQGEISLTLYAGWVPYYEFNYYYESDGDWVKMDSVTRFGYPEAHSGGETDIDEVWLPDWKNGAMDYTHVYSDGTRFNFPKIEGKTFNSAYTDISCLEDSRIVGYIKHGGSLDYEHAAVENRVQNIYVKYDEGELYKISTAKQFADNANVNGIYEIECDLDFSETKWSPLLSREVFNGKIFAKEGTVTFSNIEAEFIAGNSDRGGLFGEIGENAEIKDVCFENVKFIISSASREYMAYYGTFAGYIDENATLENVTVTGDITLCIGYTQFGENFDMDLLANINGDYILNHINYAGATFRIVLKGEPAYGGKYLYTVDRESVRVEGRKVTLSTYADIDREFEDGGEHEISF